MVYTDGVHLIADTELELHSFAQNIGMRREWYQDNPRHPHYDITSPKILDKAIRRGAKMIDSKQLLKIVNNSNRT